MFDNAPRVPLRRILPWVVFAMCSALAVYSRFHLLGRESLWLDEATTWKRAHLEVPALIVDCLKRLHNPSYFLFMHAYLGLGDDEVMMRLPSAVLGAVTLLVTAGIGYVCGGYRVALGSLLFLAISPLRLRYDQEARMYAQYGLGAAIMLCGLFWLLLHPEHASRPLLRRASTDEMELVAKNKARLALFAVWAGGTLAWYSHNTAALLLFCAGLSVLLTLPLMPAAQRWPWLVNYAAVNALILIAYTPWLSSLLKQTKRLHEHFWAKFPTVAELRTVLFDLYLYGGFRASLCLLTLAMLGIAIWTLRGRVRLLVPLMILSFVTPGLLLLISLQRPVFISRLMLWTAIPFSVLLAVGLSSFRRPLYWTLFATLLLVGADNLDGVHYRSRHKPNFRAAMLDIAARDNAVAVLAAGRENRVFHYYTERQTNPITGLRFFSAVYKETRVLPIDDRIRGAESVFVVQARNWPTVSRVMAAVRRRGTYVRSRDYGHHLRVHEFRMRSQGLL